MSGFVAERGRRGRLAALACVGTLLAGPWAGTAAASESPFIEFGFAAGSVNPERLSGRAAMPSGLSVITSVHLSVQSVHVAGVSASNDVCGPCEPSNQVPFSWATPRLAYNGPYRLTVTAKGTETLDLDGEESASASRTFALSLPAQPPSEPKAVVREDRKVEVSWAKVTAHPDLVGYEVRRRPPGASAFTVAGHAQQPAGSRVTFVDDLPTRSPDAGVFHYEVRAIRAGAVPDDPHTAVFSTAAPASAAVPAAATTTSAPPDEGVGTGDASSGQTSTTARPADSALGDFLNRASESPAAPPVTSTAPRRATIPDTFDFDLPFSTDTSAPVTTLDPGTSRRPVRPGPSAVSTVGEEGEANRRALLVPVAAGAILCLLAFHLRVLVRRHSGPPDLAAEALVGAAPGRRRRRRSERRSEEKRAKARGRRRSRPGGRPERHAAQLSAADAALAAEVDAAFEGQDAEYALDVADVLAPASPGGAGHHGNGAGYEGDDEVLFDEYGPTAGWSEQEGPSAPDFRRLPLRDDDLLNPDRLLSDDRGGLFVGPAGGAAGPAYDEFDDEFDDEDDDLDGYLYDDLGYEDFDDEDDEDLDGDLDDGPEEDDLDYELDARPGRGAEGERPAAAAPVAAGRSSR